MSHRIIRKPCGFSEIPRLDETQLPCNGRLYSSDCVMYNSKIGGFTGGSQTDFNHFIYYELSKGLKNIQDVVGAHDFGDLEPRFDKNTAFNKNFGGAENEVARGNHTHNEFAEINKHIANLRQEIANKLNFDGHLLTDEEYEKFLDLFYKVHTVAFTVSPVSGEKGVSTNATFSYTINKNGDVITSVTMDGATGLGTTSGSHTFNNVRETLSKTLTVNYKENNKAQKSKQYNATYVAYVPQWRGKSSLEDLGDYNTIDAALSKVLQASATVTNTVQPNNEYVYFVSIKDNAVIEDMNGFRQTVGDWGNDTTEFWKKQVQIRLKDGTSQPVYLYRTRLKKTIDTDFRYTIK